MYGISPLRRSLRVSSSSSSSRRASSSPSGLSAAISSRSRSSSSGFGRRSAMRRDRLLRTVRSSARLAGEPLTE